MLRARQMCRTSPGPQWMRAASRALEETLPVNEDFKIDLARYRVVHTPTGCAYSFPEKGRSGDLQIWQVVEIGDRSKYGAERAGLRKQAFELYVQAMQQAEQA